MVKKQLWCACGPQRKASSCWGGGDLCGFASGDLGSLSLLDKCLSPSPLLIPTLSLSHTHTHRETHTYTHTPCDSVHWRPWILLENVKAPHRGHSLLHLSTKKNKTQELSDGWERQRELKLTITSQHPQRRIKLLWGQSDNSYYSTVKWLSFIE